MYSCMMHEQNDGMYPKYCSMFAWASSMFACILRNMFILNQHDQ